MHTNVPVKVHVAAGVGHLTLDRPAALNALNAEMVSLLRRALEDWRDDNEVTAVVLDSSSDRAFCAGGDIRSVRADVRAGHGALAQAFLAAEYALVRCIAEYHKPIVSLVDGYCLGAGMGLSVHATYQVVTERSQLSMPETAIGFIPDVGSSYFLSRLPGKLGRFFGLTGTRANGSEAARVGLATHYVPAADLAELRAALLRGADLASTLAMCPAAPHAGAVVEHRAEIDVSFADGPLDDVQRKLAALEGSWAETIRIAMATASPLSLIVTDELLLAGAKDDLRGCLAREYAVATHVIQCADFDEGVRALLVDKDRSPRWSHRDQFSNDLARVRSVLDLYRPPVLEAQTP